jgi:hypothetical protein
MPFNNKPLKSAYFFLRGVFSSPSLKKSRSPMMSKWRILVAVAWFTVGLCVLLALAHKLSFTFHSSTGIVGWISENNYSKKQELFWFLASVLGLPTVMLFGWVLWIASTAAGAFLARQPSEKMIKIFATLHLPIIVAWPRLCNLRGDAWQILIAAAGVSVFFSVLTILFMRFILPRFQHRIEIIQVVEQPLCPLMLEQADAPTPHARWLRIIHLAWHGTFSLFIFVAVPALLYIKGLKNDYSGNVDLFHEGEFLIPLYEMMHGGIPYRDIYLQHGLFHNAWIPWLGAELFEPTLGGVRAICAYISPLGLIASYFFILAVCRTRLFPAALLVFLSCGTIPWLPTRAMFGILSLATLTAAIKQPRGFNILKACEPENDQRPELRGLVRLCTRQGYPFLLAGVLAMLSFWYSVEFGLYSLTAGLVFLLSATVFQTGIRFWRRMIPASIYVTGVFIIFLPFSIYFGVHGALGDLVHNVWIQCAYQMETWGIAFPKFFDLFRPILTGPIHPEWPDWLIKGNIQWYYGAITLTLATSFLAFCIMGEGFWKSQTCPVLLLVTIAGICFFQSVLGRSDVEHVYCGIFFALTLVIFLVDRLLAASWDIFTTGVLRGRNCFLGLPLFGAGLAVAFCLVWYCNAAFKPVPGLKKHLAYLYNGPKTEDNNWSLISQADMSVIPAGQAELIGIVTEYIHTHTRPDETVFDFSSQAGFLFFAERRSATRYFHVSYASLPSMQEEIVSTLERMRVPLVIFRTGGWFDSIDGVPVEKRHPIIAAYLHEKYEPAGTVGSVIFWQRKVGAGN